jgi:hypothetical protein
VSILQYIWVKIYNVFVSSELVYELVFVLLFFNALDSFLFDILSEFELCIRTFHDKKKKKGIKLKKKISAFDDEAKICKKKQKFLFTYEQLNIKVRSALSLIFLYCIDGRSCCESSSLSHQLWLYYYYYNQTRNCLNSVDKFINAGRVGNSLTFWHF